jgi:hypothetical protein
MPLSCGEFVATTEIGDQSVWLPLQHHMLAIFYLSLFLEIKIKENKAPKKEISI